MPQDSFTLKFIAEELSRRLVGGKISRIVQPTRDSLIFIIYTPKGNVKLEACLSAQSARLNITDSETEVPAAPPNFCMLLRKHLQNAQILSVVQPDFERIIYFDLKCTSDFDESVKRLYFEIMGKYSNAILCEDGIISGALKTSSISENTKRVLFGGVKYVPPEPQEKFSPDDSKNISAALNDYSGDKVSFLSEKVKGISYTTALEIVEKYGENYTAEDIKNYVFSEPAAPCVTYENGEMSDFKVRSEKREKKLYPDILSAQAAYYDYTVTKKNFNDKKNKLSAALNGAIKKVEKRIFSMRSKLDECRDMERIKLKGELITANIYAIERGEKSFEAVNYYDENCEKIKIELDPGLTPAQNAQKYYKRYAKLKRTKQNVEAMLEKELKQKDYLSAIGAHICAAENTKDLEEIEYELADLQLVKAPAKKKKTDIPYRRYVYKDFVILAGRNNVQNERLTKSLAPDDMWLHTQKYHSSHVAIISRGKTVPNDVLGVAASICAYFSEARSGSKIPVDYTLKKYVQKPPASAVGFVIYTNYKTILAEPDRHSEYSEENNG